LKGFSHSLDHVRIRDKPLPAAPPRGLKLNSFRREICYKMLPKWRFANKMVVFSINNVNCLQNEVR